MVEPDEKVREALGARSLELGDPYDEAIGPGHSRATPSRHRAIDDLSLAEQVLVPASRHLDVTHRQGQMMDMGHVFECRTRPRASASPVGVAT